MNTETNADIKQWSHNYPSDISREQFELIRNKLERKNKYKRASEVDLYDVFCAILYIFNSGCPWDMLPSDFPKKATVYKYYRIWSAVCDDGKTLLGESLKEIGLYRVLGKWERKMSRKLQNAIATDVLSVALCEIFQNLQIPDRYLQIFQELLSQFAEDIQKDLENSPVFKAEQARYDELYLKVSDKDLIGEPLEYIAMANRLMEKRLYQGLAYGLQYGFSLAKIWTERENRLIDDFTKAIPKEMM